MSLQIQRAVWKQCRKLLLWLGDGDSGKGGIARPKSSETLPLSSWAVIASAAVDLVEEGCAAGARSSGGEAEGVALRSDPRCP